MKRTGLFSIFRNRNFRVFSLSQAVSQFGDKLDHVALIAVIGVMAGSSSTALAELAVFFTLPVLIFGPVSGALVDRWSRKKVMVTCDAFRGLLVILIPPVVFLSGSLWSMYLIVFAVFFMGLFFNNAKMSIIPNMVGQDQLLAANSAATLIGRIATVAAFFLGDLIVHWKGWNRLRIEGWQAGFYLDGLTFFISAVALTMITVVFRRSTDADKPGLKNQTFVRMFRRTLVDVREGFKLIMAKREITFVMASVVVLTFVGGSVYVLAVPIIQSELERGAFSYGTLGAIMAVGMVIGSFLYGNFGHRMRKSTVIIAGFGIIGTFMIVFSMLRSFLVTSGLLIISGMILAPIVITQDTLLHEIVPEEIRGRIFGTREWTLNGLFMLSAVVMSLIANFSSVRITLRGVGILVFLLAVMGLANRRSFIGNRV
ncbi:MFS transporter [candidate division TA06 bacterium]|uniref:MFS transporter n=1 Tax=candidate division TA06 bacterium TaxID=2250710 RepID=A0A523UNE0_UNCT6|nr:MAG: MFS transporter [candidate division TA06 bacterium]